MQLPKKARSLNFLIEEEGQLQYTKYLGLTITDDLEWAQHVSEISCKATKTLGFLRCNLAIAPRHTKEVAYKR